MPLAGRPEFPATAKKVLNAWRQDDGFRDLSAFLENCRLSRLH